ncbi:Uncharacterized protein Fot_32763 [Forsythia ovata]|uniref:Uncharacterized protein n=1 Tax=Forsythia ovata TaxID=205694 RepID=A0ABD1T8S0_9LAMI
MKVQRNPTQDQASIATEMKAYVQSMAFVLSGIAISSEYLIHHGRHLQEKNTTMRDLHREESGTTGLTRVFKGRDLIHQHRETITHSQPMGSEKNKLTTTGEADDSSP